MHPVIWWSQMETALMSIKGLSTGRTANSSDISVALGTGCWFELHAVQRTVHPAATELSSLIHAHGDCIRQTPIRYAGAPGMRNMHRNVLIA